MRFHSRNEKKHEEPRITRMGADNEEGHAGTPIAWVGSVFAGQLASQLAYDP